MPRKREIVTILHGPSVDVKIESRPLWEPDDSLVNLKVSQSAKKDFPDLKICKD